MAMLRVRATVAVQKRKAALQPEAAPKGQKKDGDGDHTRHDQQTKTQAVAARHAAGDDRRCKKGDHPHDSQLPSEEAGKGGTRLQFTFYLVVEDVLQNEEGQPPQKCVGEDQPAIRMTDGHARRGAARRFRRGCADGRLRQVRAGS